MTQKPLVRAVLVAAMGLTLGQCSYNPATGGQQFTAFMSPEQERQTGAQQHPEILKQFGGAYGDAKVRAYVDTLGKALATKAGLPAGQFTFTVLDDPLVNAFALPGGYVYVTRGLMALANSEAELAAVIGHEMGHVMARHTAERYSRANVAGIGSTILGVILGSPEVSQLAQQGSQLYLLSFSRGQELEADKLGVRYIRAADYDPFAEADFLSTLGRDSEMEAKIAGQQLPESDFLQTHPNTPKRVEEAIAEAEGTGLKPDPARRYPDRYLDIVNGLLYGEDPAQGVLRGGAFLHPALGLAFDVPKGLQLSNSEDAVVLQASRDSGIIFDGAKAATGQSAAQYLENVWAKNVTLAGLHQFRVGNMEAASGAARVQTQSGMLEMHLTVIRFAPDQVYRFQLISPPSPSDALLSAFDKVVTSFHRLSAADHARAKPYRVHVITVGAGDTLATLAKRMPFTDSYNVQRLVVLNALRTENDIRPGQRLKIITAD